MAAPRRPRILYFQPWPTKLVCNGERYIEDEAHTDTQVVLYDLADGGAEVDTYTVGSAETNVLVTGLTLTAGVRYRARMRYQNASGWGAWSKHIISRVPIDLAFTAIDAGSGEPATGGDVPVAPSWPQVIHRVRPLRQWTTETGHLMRRPAQTIERRWATLAWVNLATADKTSLEAFLGARIDAAEGFRTQDVATGTTTWLARPDTLQIEQVSVGTWTVRVDADEVFG